MQYTNFWYKYIILGLKIATIFLVFTSFSVYGQVKKRKRPQIDDRKFSYGFVMGIHTSAYQVKYSKQFLLSNFDTVHSVQGSFSTGFAVGFLINFRIVDEFDVRIMPKAGFYSHVLNYYYTNHKAEKQTVETTMIEFPVLLKYKSAKRKQTRMYVVGGCTPSFEAATRSNVQSSTSNFSVKGLNFTLSAGIGLDLYFPLFKLSPELRFSKGIVNILGKDQTNYSTPLTSVTTNTISLFFIFQ